MRAPFSLSVLSSGGRGSQVFLGGMAALALLVPLLNLAVPDGSALHLPDYWVTLLGKYLCYALLAIAIDLIWGYCGILSLGHTAFFALGGYAMGMYLMRQIGTRGVYGHPELPDFMVFLNWESLPWYWFGFDQFWFAMLMVLLAPGLLAFAFGWLAFRSRVTGVYLSILTQAMTLALSLYLFQNDSGLRGNNGLSGLQNLPGVTASQDFVSIWFFWASALALAVGYIFAAWIVSGKFGSVIRGIRDNEARGRFLGYSVEGYKLFLFTVTAMIAGIAGALYYPQAGIINPAEIAPIASIYLAVWVAIGGRGRLYGAVIGAAFVSLLSSWFTGGGAPAIDLGFYTILWTDWWLVLLGVSFVCVTLFFPKGIGGLFDYLVRKPS